MKKSTVISVVLILCVLVFATGVFAADKSAATAAPKVDKNAIKKQVDEIVAAIDKGKKAEDFADAAKKDPYVFIMEASGKLLVHPILLGQNLKEKAEVVFKEVSKATAEGGWMKYEWLGKKKATYARKTKSGLIVGSGISE